ncbi:ferrous iron transport protein B [Clostridium tepidiprofundi DSM 19306]|uniref:Ferrous iron transport protein B n=1 Tax=Clostridium tepidiprofundi DSM 19306 TaxID=1121338 RepID=A0A151AW58_9CLOT|nr:ferrous iron transport protein B [Clostridium tepidiprofundi]KYH31909.1 ferrous iron transport protein B [Clostridium tepidiprofundi DSM 19306]
MGLNRFSSSKDALIDLFNITKKHNDDFVIALAGNPNTGKSTVFNALTGLHQHTGNWPGKTVTSMQGDFTHKKQNFILVDLPGTYSLLASSQEEIVARDFICFGKPDAVIVVVDATCIERNLNLLLQICEITDNIILCLNLMDEAKRKGICIDIPLLSKKLGIPVIPTTARDNKGIDELKNITLKVCTKKIIPSPYKLKYNEDISNYMLKIEPLLKNMFNNKINSKWLALRFLDGDKSILNSINKYLKYDFSDINSFKNKVTGTFQNNISREVIVSDIYKNADNILSDCLNKNDSQIVSQYKIDDILTSKIFGIPIMLLTLAVVLWLTIQGANYPSQMLSKFLFLIEGKLTKLFTYINAPSWIHGILVIGIYRTTAWVISVMLPPMAIFFPIFTILEDLGYLPRISFNLDHVFKKACAHGKQALTMCMGFGCNAAGIISCRIIDSPREKLIAILTNNFVPCNGRFPTLIAIASIFFGIGLSSTMNGILAALIVSGLVVLGIAITLLTSFILSKTFLKGVSSSFALELPPFRRPQFTRVIYTSIIDRTIFVLVRAVKVAAPAGVIIYILSNIYIGNMSIVGHIAAFLNPFAHIIGLDGFILLAFILGFPANEIVIPILIMAYLSKNTMTDFTSLHELKNILVANGWTHLTALNVMLFSLLHFPCATTVLTIRKETKSIKWTLFSIFMPTSIAIIICFITTQMYNLIQFYK